MDETSLISQIEKAFEGRPLPSSDSIVNHHCVECERVSAVFRGRHWREWAADPLGYLATLNLDFRPLLTTEAQQFYLPIFMIGCIRDHEKADVFCDALIGSFVPPSERLAPEMRLTAEEILREGLAGMPESEMVEVRQAISDSLAPSPGHAKESIIQYDELIDGLSRAQLKAIYAFCAFMLHKRGDVSAATLARAMGAISDAERKR